MDKNVSFNKSRHPVFLFITKMIYFSKYRNFEGEKIDFERLKIIEKVTGEKHYFSKTIFKLSNSGCEG